jgi:hypothetical protein
MVELLCADVCNGEMIPVETIPEMSGGGIKKNDEGG